MSALSVEDRKARRATALKTTKEAMSKVERIHQAFVSGRAPASELRRPSEAVRSAALLLRELQDRMSSPQYGLDPKDCAVHIAYVDTNFIGAYTRPILPGKEEQEKLIEYLQGQPVIMLGVLFTLRDREADPTGHDAVVGLKAFITTQRSVDWLTDLRESVKADN